MFSGRSPWRHLLLLLLVALSWDAGARHSDGALAGRLSIDGAPQQAVVLDGEWGFSWHEFVDPRWEDLPTRAFAPAGGSWNDLTADGKPRGPEGWGSYALRIDCPTGTSLALEAKGQRTASRLFVNGELVASQGEPGTSPAQTRAAVPNRVPITREFDCPLRVTLHLANFDHRVGGFLRPLTAGSVDALARYREGRQAFQVALLTAYLLTGFVALIFFSVRRRERTPLVFGLFCLCMGLYTDLIGERLLIRWLPQEVPWQPFMQAEYLSWIAAMGLFVLTVRKLFPAEIHRRVVSVLLALLGVGALSTVLLPPALYSWVNPPGQFIAVVAGAWVARAMLRAQSQNRVDARVLLAGMLAVVATLALDLLLVEHVSPDRKFSPLGFALFLLSPAIVIARRMSHALNAEQRSRTLEENARLREDVERMSRHDLKTPLNSVLGVARLLRDDPRLEPDQRQLVGVLQRAGLRMLEMVNLSLGLFKMETGSYDFHPQPVDLREVVNRVLVDLARFAKDSGVELRVVDKDAGPVWVRAEELLCYSIVANLVKNAVEATGARQAVSLRLLRGDPVRLSIHNPGAVTPEIVDRFFDKYVTGGKRGGAGLGTYSARLMARAQQGEVTMRTDAVEGTTLTLNLRPLKGPAPAVARSEPAPLLPATSPELLDGMPPRELLLVDDDEFSLLVTSQLLPPGRFRVETASNGQGAIEAMMRRWPQVLLLDMEMPVRNGIETLHWVRDHEASLGLPRCHVVMLSGYDDAASRARAIDAGADRFLTKPVSREELTAATEALPEALRSR